MSDTDRTGPPSHRRVWKWGIVGAVVAVSAALTVGVASASSTPAVQFTKVQYNSPGSDNRSNASLNGEWFQVTNKTKKAVSVAGWTVKDVAGHTYKLTGTLKAGASLTVHTGRGTANKPSGHRYWGSKSYIWNNTGDTATLRTGKGGFVHKCVWGSSGSVTTCATKPTTKPPTRPTTKPAPAPTRTTATPTTSPTTTSPPTTPPPPVTVAPGEGDGGETGPPPVIG
jgi:hypothetical protein